MNTIGAIKQPLGRFQEFLAYNTTKSYSIRAALCVIGLVGLLYAMRNRNCIAACIGGVAFSAFAYNETHLPVSAKELRQEMDKIDYIAIREFIVSDDEKTDIQEKWISKRNQVNAALLASFDVENGLDEIPSFVKQFSQYATRDLEGVSFSHWEFMNSLRKLTLHQKSLLSTLIQLDLKCPK